MADHQCTVCQDLLPTWEMVICAICGQYICDGCHVDDGGDRVCTNCLERQARDRKRNQHD